MNIHDIYIRNNVIYIHNNIYTHIVYVTMLSKLSYQTDFR